MKLALIFVFNFIILTSSAFATPTCEELQTNWLDKYHADFKIQWKKDSFDCPSPMARVADTFYYLEQIRFKGLKVPNYKKFIQKGLQGIRYKNEHETMSWAHASEKGGFITLYNGFVNDDNTLQRVEILIHEARHMRANDPGHENCVRGSSVGKAACDKKFESSFWLGSGYNYGFKFLELVSNSSYNHDLNKRAAELSLKWMVSNRFNIITNDEIRRYSR